MSSTDDDGSPFRKAPVPTNSSSSMSSFHNNKLEDKIERMLCLSLALTAQPWNELGLGSDPLTKATSDRSILVERIASLFIVRCVTMVLAGKYSACNADQMDGQPPKSPFKNLSTSNVCQQLLNKSVEFPYDIINEKFVRELCEYVRRMLLGYKEVPYHSREHAYHVVLSVNKIIDMMVSGKNVISVVPDDNNNNNVPSSKTTPICPYVTFGLRHDPLALFSLMFAALIHDVEHQGIPNRQLAIEDDRLAVLYNDQSMAENWSLYVCFSELLQDDFINLRSAIMMKDKNDDEYRRFRKYVVGLVLSTDIASPERTQLNKSKWKEAFGDTYETIERKLKAMNSKELSILARRMSLSGRHIVAPSRRPSNLSTISGLGEDDLHNSASVNEDEYEYDNSLSGTPDVSESELECDGNRLTSIQEQRKLPRVAEVQCTKAVQKKTRRASVQTGYIPATVERRLSIAASVGASTADTSKYRQRLGILRTVDLSGETIEAYTRRGSMVSVASAGPLQRGIARNASASKSNSEIHFAPDKMKVEHGSTVSIPSNPSFRSKNGEVDTPLKDGVAISEIHVQPLAPPKPEVQSSASVLCPSVNYDADEPDELKASVVMETIMVAADVAHNLQGWEHMVKWSTRLYMELRRAFIAKRGFDPADRWFENQIGFLESYLLPVARRLEDTGVFHETNIGLIFSSTVEGNRDKWMIDGEEITKKAIQEGEKRFPLPSK